MNKKIIFVGAGVATINAITKLVDNGYPGELITVYDKGRDPYTRLPSEVMEGFAGCGAWSDGKLTYHTAIGGQLSKYCGEEKAMELMDQVINNFRRFHPKPEIIMCSHPTEEPDFIKPYFGLRLFPVWHIGTDYLLQIAQKWYDYLVSKNINFKWEHEVTLVGFNTKKIEWRKLWHSEPPTGTDTFDEIIIATGKSGIDFSGKLIEKYNLKKEPKSIQVGVRFEAPQKYFQKLIDISYDFKLYRKPTEDVSLRSFCTNNNAAYVAVEETYGDISYNGHAKKGDEHRNDMTNFGIIMEIKGIDDPFKWSRELVQKCNVMLDGTTKQQGIYYSPSRTPSLTSEGNKIDTYQEKDLRLFKDAFGKYADYIIHFIDDMNKVFNFGEDWGIYIPECKYVTQEPLTNYDDLSLIDYPEIHFAGDALSARGISVSGGQGIYIAESILRKSKF